jgi:hypothetical protein
MGEAQGKKETHPISAGWVSEDLAALPTPRRPSTTTRDGLRGALSHNVHRIRGPGNSVKHTAVSFSRGSW